MIERTLVLLKPDAVKRGIVGEIIDRLEQTGLKIVGAKFTKADRDLAAKHYNKDDAWKEKIGKYSLQDAEKFDVDVKKIYGTDDPVKIGDVINETNYDYLTSGPLLALVFEGIGSVSKVRKMVGGSPYSSESEPGTIRGDYGLEDPYSTLEKGRTAYNLIHASGTVEEAKSEISLWFTDKELFDYKNSQENVYGY